MARRLLTQQREHDLVMLRTDHLATETRRPRPKWAATPRGHKFLKGYEPTGQAGAMNPDCGREGLSETFDRAAAFYQQARPDYPAGLFDDLITVTGLAVGDRLLGIGCATRLAPMCD